MTIHPLRNVQTPSQRMLAPALPVYPPASGPARTRASTSSPIRPSPLRETMSSASLDSPSGADVADFTPETKGKTNSEGVSSVLTPPRSAGPLVVDGSKRVNATTASRIGEIDTSCFGQGAQFIGSIGKPGFVISNSSKKKEDPFVSSSRPASTPSTPTPSTSRSTTKSTTTSPSSPYSPRHDRLSQPASARNAQGLFPPQACVFIANLSNQKTDEQLEYLVKEVFDQFGTCHAKIRRDRNQMPFAFVQYERVTDAAEALRNGKGRGIDGRPIRVEKAHANRAVYLVRLTGGYISDQEARGVLEVFGEIEEICPTSVTDQEIAGLPEGTYVKFAFFQDCRDAIVAFRHHDLYNLRSYPGHEPGKRGTLGFSPSPQRFAPCLPWSPSDARSVFVGNIPPGTTDAAVSQTFSQFGRVLSATVISKPVTSTRVNTFAFVGFQTASEATHALNSNVYIGGWHVRIEPKEYTYRANPRFRSEQPSPQNSQQQAILSTLYSQGLQMGLPHDQASRILDVGQRTDPFRYGTQASIPNFATNPYAVQASLRLQQSPYPPGISTPLPPTSNPPFVTEARPNNNNNSQFTHERWGGSCGMEMGGNDD